MILYHGSKSIVQWPEIRMQLSFHTARALATLSFIQGKEIRHEDSDFYYQSRDYLFACYQEGEICP